MICIKFPGRCGSLDYALAVAPVVPSGSGSMLKKTGTKVVDFYGQTINKMKVSGVSDTAILNILARLVGSKINKAANPDIVDLHAQVGNLDRIWNCGEGICRHTELLITEILSKAGYEARTLYFRHSKMGPHTATAVNLGEQGWYVVDAAYTKQALGWRSYFEAFGVNNITDVVLFDDRPWFVK